MTDVRNSPEAPAPKPWITTIHTYVPGKSAGDIVHANGQAPVKLSANENPLGTSAKALASRNHAATPSLYPDPGSNALREAIGELHGLDPARIVMGTGSGELLNLAVQGYAGLGDEVIYVRHGFSVYEIAARRCAATPVVAPDADYGSDVDAMLAQVTDQTRVVFIANPNNPTGSFLSKDEVARLHAGLPSSVLLVVDQAYGEYVAPEDDDGALALAEAHPNVLVTRTFSKIYGLAGERIGWGTGAQGIVDTLNRIRAPFNVSGTGQAMALAALADEEFVEYSRDHNRRERDRFVAAIDMMGNHGLRALPSQANYVLVLFEGAFTAQAAYEGLMEIGYITRWLPGQGLPHGLRITIGEAADMDAIAAALRMMVEAAG
ncbi:MAG: histidinol-phosphate transaminase [Novosphingobium sp.]|nr:histidinol-phosphate transaminase [Novosphingobium sp.]